MPCRRCPGPTGAQAVRLYAVQFREGILFAQVPGGVPSDQLANVLGQRAAAAGEPVRAEFLLPSRLDTLDVKVAPRRRSTSATGRGSRRWQGASAPTPGRWRH